MYRCKAHEHGGCYQNSWRSRRNKRCQELYCATFSPVIKNIRCTYKRRGLQLSAENEVYLKIYKQRERLGIVVDKL